MNLVYSKEDCPYCNAARDELNKRGIQFTELKLGVDYQKADLQALLPDVEKLTVPQIWFGNRHIGGYDDLVQYFEETDFGAGDDFN